MGPQCAQSKGRTEVLRILLLVWSKTSSAGNISSLLEVGVQQYIKASVSDVQGVGAKGDVVPSFVAFARQPMRSAWRWTEPARWVDRRRGIHPQLMEMFVERIRYVEHCNPQIEHEEQLYGKAASSYGTR